MKRRPTMPAAVRCAAIYLNMQKNGGLLICEETGHAFTLGDILGGSFHIDHVPPLALRYRNEEGGYEPDANDTRFLEVVSPVGHIHRTSKRRGLRRGDLTEIARTRRIRQSNGLEPPSQRPKRKIPSRPFPKRIKP